MDTARIAYPAHEPTTRTERILALYRTRSHETRRAGEDFYLVSSQDGERTYRVHYGEHEFCSCPDHSYSAAN